MRPLGGLIQKSGAMDARRSLGWTLSALSLAVRPSPGFDSRGTTYTPTPSAALARLMAPEYLAAVVAGDVYAPCVGELIRCWFCFRSALILWTPGFFRCTTSGSCRRFYVAAASNLSVSPTRSRCRRCRGLVFRLRTGTGTRAAERTCTRCHDRQPLSFPLDLVGLLISAEDRAALRVSGDLSATGAPTFRRAKISDRRAELEREAARLGTVRTRNVLRRYVYQQRRRQLARIKRGQDPDLDARRFRR